MRECEHPLARASRWQHVFHQMRSTCLCAVRNTSVNAARGVGLDGLSWDQPRPARLWIAQGAEVRVRSRVGAVEVTVALTDDLRPGVVSLPHGWGHRGGKRPDASRPAVPG